MTHFHVGIEFTGADTHECDTVSVSLVHVSLDFENKCTELMLRRVNHADVCFSWQRRGSHIQEML